MKSLSKLHQEAIIKARNATDQNKAAAMAMIEKPIEMIKAIMLKHELAVIEVMRELHESREAAVRAEREACAKVCEEADDFYGSIFAAAIRAINFEGDTGFRPVSEMVAEHKQDPKKAAAIAKATGEKA